MVLSDPQVNKERRVTGVSLVLQEWLVPKETTELPGPQVLSAPRVLLDYMVLLAPKELKGHRVKLDLRERLVFLDFLALLVLLEMSSTHSPSRLPSRADRAGTSTPAR